MKRASIPLLLSVCWVSSAQTQQANFRPVATKVLEEARPDFREWKEAVVADSAYAFFRPDLPNVAYYEFPVRNSHTRAPAGFIIVSTGPHDYPVTQWSTTGKSNAEKLEQKAAKLGKRGSRYYVLDVISFAVEDQQGRLIDQLGDYHVRSSDWSTLKREFAAKHAKAIKHLRTKVAPDWKQATRSGGQALSLGSCGLWKYYSAGSTADQRFYSQIPAHTAPNTSSCWSGCGPTAWGMLFGWADYQASINNPEWIASYNLYGGPADAAPATMTAGVEAMLWKINGYVQTTCAGDQGLTWPWRMDHTEAYFHGRPNTALGVTVLYNPLGIANDGYQDKADDEIRNGNPVVVALGWEHYALAYGYRKKICSLASDRHEFHINDGDGTERWTTASTFFVGTLDGYGVSQPWVDPCPAGKRCCWITPEGGCGHCVTVGQPCDLSPLRGCRSDQKCCEAGTGGKPCSRCIGRNQSCQ
jgi:hypothetical protein